MRSERDINRIRSIMTVGNPVPGDAFEDSWQDQFEAEAHERIVALVWEEAAGQPPIRSRVPGSRPALSRRAKRLIAPAAAVLAVVAVLAGVAIAGRTAGSRQAEGGAGGVMSAAARRSLFGTGTIAPQPAYFVGISSAVSRGSLGVYRATTGRIVARLRPPAGLFFVATAATADSRTFVVAAIPRTVGTGHGTCATWLYRLRLNADGQPRLTALAVPKIVGGIFSDTGLAASANGRVIAYSANECGGGNGWVGIINLATRQARTWPLRSEGVISMSLSADGGLLGFNDTTVLEGDGAVRVLGADSPPGPMIERARVVLPGARVETGQSQADQQVALSPAGTVMLACTDTGAAASASQPPNSAVLTAYDVSTGRLIGVLHTWHSPYISPCLISVAPSGGYVLMSGIHSGHFTRINLVTGRLTEVTVGWVIPPSAISW